MKKTTEACRARTGSFTQLCGRTFAACLPLFACLAVQAQDPPPPDPAALRADCEGLKLADFTRVVDAPTKVSESFLIEASGDMPASCLVRGYVAPQVGFQMKLPAENWNGKLLEVGSGGYAGSTQGAGEQRWCDEAVRRGYACIHSDHGHTAGIGEKALAPLDGLWAYNNPQAEIDFAFRGFHVVALAQKAIARHYYGASEKHAYFMGCSGGGRQALVAAQRFPWDFDGIVAMEPAINWSRAFMTFLYHWRTVTDAEGKPLFTPADLTVLHEGAVASCDMDDGVADGVIGDPPACDFDPARLACAEGQAEQCLSPVQVSAAKKMYAGPVTSSGKKLYPGHVMPGGEMGSFGFQATRPLVQYALKEYFRYMAFMPDAGPTWQLEDFDFDTDYQRLALVESLLASTNPDLREFRDEGGKLIIVQGWDDGGTPFPLSTIDYYESVQRSMGGEKATQDFARLFMIPGRAHCMSGDGAGAASFLGALENWVEEGQAPDMIKLSRIEGSTDIADYLRGPAADASVKFTRPAYPYPLRAKYKGKGDPNDYRNFRPVR